MRNVAHLAYFAGILDGEGHFSIIYDKTNIRHHPIVGVMNTSEELIGWLKSNVGGVVYSRKGSYHKDYWKPRFEWRMNQTTIDLVLPSVLPFLVVKRRQAELMIKFRSTFKGTPRGSTGLPAATLETRNAIRAELLAVNDRRRSS